MNFDNFTIKSQEAIQKAVEIVRNHNEQSIETGTPSKRYLASRRKSYLIPFFKKLGVNAGFAKQPSRQRK